MALIPRKVVANVKSTKQSMDLAVMRVMGLSRFNAAQSMRELKSAGSSWDN